MMKLNLGCGKFPMEGYVNLDKYRLEGVDIVHDLDLFPYPFKNNSVEFVYMNHVLEHLEDIPKFFEELYRICRKGAIIRINVPHFSYVGAYKDVTHKHFFSYYSLDTFTEKYTTDFYSKASFKMLEKRIIYNRWFFIFEKIANFFPKFNEVFLCKWFPVQSLKFVLEVRK